MSRNGSTSKTSCMISEPDVVAEHVDTADLESGAPFVYRDLLLPPTTCVETLAGNRCKGLWRSGAG